MITEIMNMPLYVPWKMCNHPVSLVALCENLFAWCYEEAEAPKTRDSAHSSGGPGQNFVLPHLWQPIALASSLKAES